MRQVACTRFAVVATLAAAALSGSAAAEQAADQEATLWEWVEALYNQAKAAGETVPADVTSWFRQDLQRLGTWEYRVETVEADPAILTATLNRLGAERWECVWIEPHGERRRLTLKRPVRSWVGSVRWLDLLKLIREDAPPE